MRSLIFVLIFVFFMILAIRLPYVGYYFYYWLTISNASHFTYAPSYSWTKYAAVVTILSFLVFELKKCQHLLSPISAMMIVLSVWIWVTTQHAMFPDAAAVQLEIELKVFFMAVIGALILSTPARLHGMVWVIQAAMIIYAVNGTVLMMTGRVGETPGVPSTLVGGTNEAARALLYTIPLAMYLRATSRQALLRWVALAVAVLLSLALLVTGSRGATVAFFAIASLGALRSKHRFRWLGAVGLVATIGTFLTTTVAFQNWWARFSTTSNYEDDGSFQTRVEVWNNAKGLIEERPIFGGGFDVFEEAFDRASHNTYVEWAGEHGLVGLALFMLLLFFAWRATGSTLAKTKDRPDLAWAWHLMQAGRYIIIAYLIGGLTKNDGFNELMFLNIAIIEGTRRVVNARLQEARRPDAVQSGAVQGGRLVKEPGGLGGGAVSASERAG